MNIFYLHKDPVEAAKLQYNKHVVKMILESAQMLCTAHHHYGNGDKVPYKKAHYNHPSTIWVRENAYNYLWLYRHMLALGDEYTKRYGKQHLTITKCYDPLFSLPPGIPVPKQSTHTQPPQAMPDEHKHKCSVQAYWNYYIADKSVIANLKKETLYETRPKETY
jgi:hypothetical protein